MTRATAWRLIIVFCLAFWTAVGAGLWLMLT
jgi:hypothetical protein